MSFSRADRSRLAEWWFTVDRQLIVLIFVLMAAGLLLSLAASPAIAMKRGFATYHFVWRQFVFAGLGAAVMIAVSLLTPAKVRRLALITLIASMAGLVVVLFVGTEINGARRWLPVLHQTIQPSEFAKPGFVVMSAWLFAETKRRPDMPALALACLSLMLIAGLLIAEPDVGQTLLVTFVWGALFVISGQPWMGAVALAVFGAAGAGAAYVMLPHVHARVDLYLAGGTGDHSQVDRALQAFMEGGFFGRGPGEGTVKTVLPDAHTDFIFAVLAEEYGVIACLALLALFAAIVGKAAFRAVNEPDSANRLAIIGLCLLFALQALINMGVNVGLLPAKGMTLPFISAGGSSTLAVSVTLGMLLSLTRKRTGLANLKKPRLVATGPRGTGEAPMNEPVTGGTSGGR